MFYPGTSLHPSMWSRGDTGDKEAWRVCFESSYRGNGKEREIEAKKKREKELKELLLEEKPGLILDRACQPLSMWQIFDVEIIAGEGSAQSSGTTYDCDELLSNTPTYTQMISLWHSQYFCHCIQSRPNLKALLLWFCYIHIPRLKQSLLKYKILKHVGLKTLHNLLRIFVSFFSLKETGSHFALVKRAHKTQPQGQRRAHIQTLLQVFRLKHCFRSGS